jgi:hypothetical protein
MRYGRDFTSVLKDPFNSFITDIGKVKVVLALIKHALVVEVCIFNLGTREGSERNFSCPGIYCMKGWVRPRASLDEAKRKKRVLPISEKETESLSP